MTKLSEAEAVTLFGNRFLTEAAPSKSFPEHGMRPVDAMRLLGEDLALEGDPQRRMPRPSRPTCARAAGSR